MIHGRCYLCGDQDSPLASGLCAKCAPGREVWEQYMISSGEPCPEQPRRTAWWAWAGFACLAYVCLRRLLWRP